MQARGGATRKRGAKRPIKWSGYSWGIRGTTSSAGPGPNAWSDTPLAAEVDADGNLNLHIFKIGSVWQSVEVEGPHLGYGQYTWTVNTDPTAWDIKPVLGLFTYDDTDDGSHGYREIDIELSLWNYAPEPSRIWYSNQPTSVGSTTIVPRVADHAVTAATPYTCTFIWQPGQIFFRTTDNTGKVLGEHVCTDSVQAPGSETIRMNLWLQGGQAPTDDMPVHVRLSSFSFTAGVTHPLVLAADTSIVFSDGTPGSLSLKNGASIVGGHLRLDCLTPDYSLAITGAVFNLTGSSVDTHIIQIPPLGNATTEGLYIVRYDPHNYFAIFVSGGGFYARLRQAGINTTNALPSYDPVAHAYWRIREAAGSVYFETSPNRSTWTVQYSQVHTLGSKIQTMRLHFECGYYGSETSPGPFVIGAVNAP